MDIRTAILRAADSIEMNPKMFSFGSVWLPDESCGTPGCALGWVGHHLGMGRNSRLEDVSRELGIPVYSCNFVELTEVFGSRKWYYSAPECAKALRLYVDKYHAAENKGIPQSVLDIFKEKVAA